ncbi:MAG: arsenite methyltransferase [Nitrososphaeraceae archaeon]
MAQESIKTKIKEKYGKIALTGNSECCCMPQECCGVANNSPNETSVAIGYNVKDLESVPQESILGVGCGAPINFAELKEGKTVVDLGSGAGIDCFLASKVVKESGKVIGIDFTDEMLNKARNASIQNGFPNIEFKKGDIETGIPVEDNTVEVVISNCVINLTTDKTRTFKEIFRILKKNGKGRMVISDLVTDKEVQESSINSDKWCSCIDGTLTKENYIKSITQAGFKDVRVLKEQLYLTEVKPVQSIITSIVVRADTG